MDVWGFVMTCHGMRTEVKTVIIVERYICRASVLIVLIYLTALQRCPISIWLTFTCNKTPSQSFL